MANSNEADDMNSLRRAVSGHPMSQWAKPLRQALIHRKIFCIIFFQAGFIQLLFYLEMFNYV